MQLRRVSGQEAFVRIRLDRAFEEANEAFSVLSDPSRRAAYDASLRSGAYAAAAAGDTLAACSDLGVHVRIRLFWLLFVGHCSRLFHSNSLGFRECTLELGQLGGRISTVSKH